MRSVEGLCWYLCGIFLVTCLTQSFVSIAPGGEFFVYRIIVVCGASAAFFALLAIYLRRRGPLAPQWILRILQVLALLATLFVLSGILG